MNHPNVTKATKEELNKECSPNFRNSYELWKTTQRQELSPGLLQIITERTVNRGKKYFRWGTESLVVNIAVSDSRIKTKLPEALEDTKSYQHIVAHPLIKSRGQDAGVIRVL